MVKKFMALLRMKYIEMFAYQWATLAWSTGAMVQPIITMMVWINIYETEMESFILYFSTLILVERLTAAWDVWDLDRDIREGSFSNYILRPIHPIHWAIAENIIYKGLFLVVLVPAWLVSSFFLPSLQLHLNGWEWMLFISALLLGGGIRFMFSYSCGLLGFWINKVTAVYAMFEGISLFFSGRIAPFSLLPPIMQDISLYLPFRYMIGFPIEVITGSVKGADLGYGFLGAFIWVLIFMGILGFLWHAGLKKNQAVGG